MNRWTDEGGATATIEPGLERMDDVIDYRRLETVLVVEDQLKLNRALSLYLGAAGLDVASAHDGMTALRRVRDVDPDVIVLDLALPKLHGFKFLHAMRVDECLRDVPVIVLTGDPSSSVDERASGWGVRRVFRKPAPLRDVVDEVLESLREN